MKKHYCFDISFPNIDLDSFMTSAEKIKKFHHVHLSADGNEIEMRIYYQSKTYFGRKLSLWLSEINWRTFGTFIKTKNEKQNERLNKIDLSNSTLIKATNSTDQIEGKLEYVKVLIDSVKFYWKPNEEEVNTAEFYLNNSGFKLVSDYYSILTGLNDKFDYGRMNGMSDYYSIGNAEFRPEFNFWVQDNKNESESKITKEPKIQFRYKKNISEKEALKYAHIVRLLASFYFRCSIDYTLARIHLKKSTITIKKKEAKNESEFPGNLWAFKNHWNFDKFMKSEWQKGATSNYIKLTKTIELFLQSLLVNSGSRFLILYNIIEVCMSGTKVTEKKFSITVSKKEQKKKYEEALAIILQTIKPSDHTTFKQKWSGVPPKLEYKPMKSPLVTFFEKQGLNPSEFPISITELKKIRDNIVHGSINKVSNDQLEKANIIMHRIAGILILNLLGIKEWKLDKTLK